MTGRTRRRALLLGCNSGGLEHCERDAQRMEDALTRCGWQVADCLTSTDLQLCCTEQTEGRYPWSPAGTVAAAVREFLNGCQHGDTAALYFSGHSHFAHGVFNLVVGNDQNDPCHLLSVVSLVELVRQQQQKLAERLLIIDCCEAAEAASSEFWNEAAGAWARIWVAARTNEHAQELDGDTNGGLFTALIVRALADEAPRLAEPDGSLRIAKVDELVRKETLRFNANRPKPAPRPGLYGNTSQNILLAEGLSPRAVTGFSPEALANLRDLLHASGLSDTELARHYREVMSGSGLSAAEGYRGPTGAYDTVGFEGALRILAEAWYRPFHSVKVPLAEYVERSARAAKTNAPELRAWLRDGLRGLAAGQDIDVFLASLDLGRTEVDGTKVRPKSHLAVALTPCDANAQTQYAVEVRLVDASGVGDSVVAPIELEPARGIARIMQRALNERPVCEAMRDLDGPFSIEFFLPAGLLREDVDDWTPPRPSPEDPPFSERHIVTVRALERVGLGIGPDGSTPNDAESYIADWVPKWNTCAPCRDAQRNKKNRPACCVWVPHALRSYRKPVRRGGCIFVLGFRPTAQELALMLGNGLAAILWGNEPLDQGFLETLMAEVGKTYPSSPKRRCFADLPHAVLHLRQDACEQTPGKTGGYHLLWDNPGRIPAFIGHAAFAATTSVVQPPLRLRSPF